MTLHYTRGDIVSVPNPYAENKLRSAVVLTDERRPLHDDGEMRYTLVMLTTAAEEFGDHDWVAKLDRTEATKDGDPPLKKDSYVEPWATYVVRHDTIRDRHTGLTRDAMEKVAKAYVRMILQ